jgi:elongation factor P
MATTADIRNGLNIRYNGKVYTVIDFQHVKRGRGGAFVRVKLKEVKTGRILEETFDSGEEIEIVRLDFRKFQFLYKDGNEFVFMDLETFDQIHVPSELVGENALFMKENETVDILFDGDQILGIQLPTFVELEVVETEPGIKGDTVTNVMKPAKLETGAVINVPLFIEQGDKIKVDTRTGEYVERVK